MAIGKNKKTGKKGQKKKVIDPMSRKQWFELKAPAPFQAESFGYTCANRTAGQKKVQDNVKGRVVTQMQADLAPNQENFDWRKFKLVINQVEGRQALCTFHGVDTSRDELCYLIKKRKNLIETVQDCKSLDGYILRVFVVAFTKESSNQKKRTNYALSSQQKIMRKRITDAINAAITKASGTKLVNLFTSEYVEREIQKDVSKIYPVRDVKIRKVKVIQAPKIDTTKLAELHDGDQRKLQKNIQKKKKKGKTAKDQLSQPKNLVDNK